MDLVRFALERHVAHAAAGVLLIIETGAGRELVTLPSHGGPVAAAVDHLRPLMNGDSQPARVVVVWRTRERSKDGASVPVRYGCAHVRGEPKSRLFVQHYSATASHRPVGEPELVDRAAPLTPPLRTRRETPWWQRDPFCITLVGGVGGMLSGGLAVEAANRYGQSTVHSATVTETSLDEPVRHDGHYNVLAETDAGELVDFEHTDPRRLYEVLEPGQRIDVAISELTGRPIAVDAAGVHYDLFLPSGGLGVSAAILIAVAIYLRGAPWRVRLLWGTVGAAAGFIFCVLAVTGVL